jgi:hypothetical protein
VSTTTGVSQTATFDTAYGFGSADYDASKYSFGSFYDSATGWYFNGYVSSLTIYIASYKVSSTGAITNVNTLAVAGANANYFRRGVIFKDTTSGKIIFVVGGENYTTIQMQAITVNSSTGALTAAGLIGVAHTFYSPAGFDAYFDSYANRIVVCAYTGSGSIYVYAYSYNGSAFSLATSTSFSMYSDNTSPVAAAFNSNTNTGRVFFRELSSGQSATRTISLNAAGNTFTIGASSNFSSNQFIGYAHAAYFPSIDRFVLQHSVNSIITFLINPSTGAYVAADGTVPLYAIYYSWQNFGFSSTYDTVNNVVYSAGTDGTGSTGLYTWSYTLTASSITYANGSNLANSSITVGTSYAYNPTLGRGGITTRNPNINQFIGFSTQSVSTGAPVTVTIVGGINTNQSALTTGSVYYLQLTGALSTTPSGYGAVARALSATSVQVTNGGAFKKLISQTVISGSPSSLSFTLPSGYSQFELTFQNVAGGSSGSPNIVGTTSGGSTVNFYGRGLIAYSSISGAINITTSGLTALYLTDGQSHAASQTFGGSVLLQSSASNSVWTYQLMTSFYNSDYSYYSATGYINSTPASLTLSGLTTFNNGGVVTLYGIG